MTDLERMELAIRRVEWLIDDVALKEVLTLLANELSMMTHCPMDTEEEELEGRRR